MTTETTLQELIERGPTGLQPWSFEALPARQAADGSWHAIPRRG